MQAGRYSAGTMALVIPNFRPRIGNRCNHEHHTGHFRASILDFKLKLANRCSKEVKKGGIRAAILDFMPRVANRCSAKVKTRAILALILDFKPRIENRCSQKGKTGAIPPALGRTALCRGRGMPDGQADADAGTLSTLPRRQTRPRERSAQGTKKESRLIAESGLSKRGSYLLSHLV